ncbi:protein phosphatase 2C [Bacillus toyonensis]|uniref:protein phosphatase 2C n=1 Tax=Bacillus toyonensis TaxID=155322 RepID=UPI003D654D13
MEKMFKKIKKFMIVATAAFMLSVGFATVAPKEASAHWADTQMNWAFKREIVTADMRDSLATRQDTWLMITRTVLGGKFNIDYGSARDYVMSIGMTDGSRGTSWVTRSEVASMALHMYEGVYTDIKWDPKWGFVYTDFEAENLGIFDGTRGNEFATRAEVITMIYNAPWTH